MPEYSKIAEFARFSEAEMNRGADALLTYLLAMLEEHCRESQAEAAKKVFRRQPMSRTAH